MWIEALGWLSALLLVSTLGEQVHRLWGDGLGPSPPRWLLFGQLLAAAGFMVYSTRQHSAVFTFVSALLMLGSAAGLAVLLGRSRRRHARLPGTRGRVIWLASLNISRSRTIRSLSAPPWRTAPVSTP